MTNYNERTADWWNVYLKHRREPAAPLDAFDVARMLNMSRDVVLAPLLKVESPPIAPLPPSTMSLTERARSLRDLTASESAAASPGFEIPGLQSDIIRYFRGDAMCDNPACCEPREFAYGFVEGEIVNLHRALHGDQCGEVIGFDHFEKKIEVRWDMRNGAQPIGRCDATQLRHGP